MAYNDHTAKRISRLLEGKGIAFSEKKMFSGLCFMVDDKMCCGIHLDKKTNRELLLCRIGEETYKTEIEKDECIPMEFTGRPMIGFIYVLEAGFQNDKDLTYWLQQCLDFNPFAKKSKKKK